MRITTILRAAMLAAVVAAGIFTAAAQQAPTPYFPLPEVPADLTTLNDRADYLVEHYWDRCNMKSAFSARDKMAGAFSTYLELMPLASADVVMESIDRFLKSIKKNHEGTAFIITRAEAELYSDSAQYQSDEVFLRFLAAARDCKKLDSDTKKRYAQLESRLSASQLGAKMPDMPITLTDGTRSSMHSIIDGDTTSITIVYLPDPAHINASMDRTRLEADSRIRNFIADGVLKFVVLYPASGDAAWMSYIQGTPSEWIAGASPEADALLDRRVYPGFYVLDRAGVIRYKNLDIDNMFNLIYQF